MGKNANKRNKASHKGDINQDRSKHWKRGKSSGNGSHQNRISRKHARRTKTQGK